MKELTIEHLVIEYGGEYICTHYGDDRKVIIIGVNLLTGVYRVASKEKIFHTKINFLKPIRRPLSGLIKEIEHNGKKFVPMLLLFPQSVKEENDFEVYGTIPDYWKVLMKINVKNWDYWQVHKLISWHFDINGLIEAGLAIDKNIIK